MNGLVGVATTGRLPPMPDTETHPDARGTVHSPRLEMTLVYLRRSFDVSAVGHKFAVVRNPVFLPPAIGVLHVSIDGEVRSRQVRLPDGIRPGRDRQPTREYPGNYPRVFISLTVDGETFEVAATGPDFVRFRKPVVPRVRAGVLRFEIGDSVEETKVTLLGDLRGAREQQAIRNGYSPDWE